MHCPFCSAADTAVKDSRTSENQVRRRRSCTECGSRFTTYERIELRRLYVIKKNNEKAPFDYDKLKCSVVTAMHKHSINHNAVDRLISSIVRQLETSGETMIATKRIGELVLEKLYHIDPIAYIRFASIYHQFGSIEDFVGFISGMSHAIDHDAEDEWSRETG